MIQQATLPAQRAMLGIGHGGNRGAPLRRTSPSQRMSRPWRALVCAAGLMLASGGAAAQALTVATVATNVACNGESTGAIRATPIGGTGPYTYSWAPVAGNSNSLTNLAAGTYTVTVTDATLATVSRTVTLTEPPRIVTAIAGVSHPTYFGANNGTVQVTASGGTPPLMYRWSPGGATTNAIAGLTAGTYTVTVMDANACTQTAAQTLTQPARPVASADAYNTPFNTTLNVAAAGVLANDTVSSGLPLSAVLATGPLHGALVLNADGSFSYTPAVGFAGGDSFTYFANDGANSATPATVSITVVPPAPTAAADTYTTAFNTPLTVAAPGVLANDTAPAGLALAAARVSGPANGAVTLNADGSFTYTPNTLFSGTDSFTYTASNGAISAPATVSITVGLRPLPVGIADSYTTPFNTVLTAAAPGVLGNDSAPSRLALTAALVAGPANGTLVFNADGSFTYTPRAGYSGTDSFTYVASDGVGTAPITVSLTVAPDGARSVPTLSQWALLWTCLLLGASAAWRLRHRPAVGSSANRR